MVWFSYTSNVNFIPKLCTRIMCLPYMARSVKGKSKGLPQGIPCRLRPRNFLTFGTTTVVGRQPYAPREKSLVLIFKG